MPICHCIARCLARLHGARIRACTCRSMPPAMRCVLTAVRFIASKDRTPADITDTRQSVHTAPALACMSSYIIVAYDDPLSFLPVHLL